MKSVCRSQLKGNLKEQAKLWYTQIRCLLQESDANFRWRVAIWIVTGCVHIVLVSLLFYDNVFVSVLLSPYLLFYMREQYEMYMEFNKRQLNIQFKDLIVAISFSLNVGYSIENAFKEALKEMEVLYGKNGQIVREFRRIVGRVERNERIEKVLLEFALNSGIEDIYYFAQVFEYAKSSGGDLISIIKRTANTIREKIEVENEIVSVLSGKKMEQRIMSAMPLGIIVYLRVTSPEFIIPLYGNLLGVVVMSMCLIAYMGADYVSKRIVKITV